jgi:hypothetical protein
MTYRKLWGYQSFDDGQWVFHRGLFNLRSAHGTPATR